MTSLEQYLKDPCGSSALPYWKQKNIIIPENILVTKDSINQSDYKKVEEFFKLIYDFNLPKIDKNYQVQKIEKNDFNELMLMINESYVHEGISINTDDLINMTNLTVYDESLWLKILKNGKIIASCISNFDDESKEGSIEWLQVLPKYRHKGYGKMLLLETLRIMEKKAIFVTVSGNLHNVTNPINLYKSCGFVGDVVWKICYKDRKSVV